jgi:hypothetical protein
MATVRRGAKRLKTVPRLDALPLPRTVRAASRRKSRTRRRQG